MDGNDDEFKLFDDEFMCIAVTGDYRSGKTLYLTFQSIKIADSYPKIYANYDLFGLNNFVKLDKLTEGVLNSIDDGSVLTLTELYKYLDNRKHGDRRQIDLTEALNELGKREIVLMGDVFKVGLLDKRLREIFNVHIRANGSLKEYDKRLSHIFSYSFVHDTDILPNLYPYAEQDFYVNMRPYFDRYNTKERINKKRVLDNWIQQ